MSRILLLACAAMLAAHADNVVSYNFDNNGTVGNPDGTYNSTDTAGVVASVGWHNDWWTYQITNLEDDANGATSLDIALSHNGGTWNAAGGHPGQDLDGSYNNELLAGYLNGNGLSTLTLSEIPYSNYDLYVYVMSDDDNRVGTATDGTTTYYFGAHPTSINAGGNAVFTQATATDATGFAADANYVVFSGLSGTDQTIGVQIYAADGTTPDYGGIAGFQVVAVAGSTPEITSQPQDYDGFVGDTFVLSAGVVADPAPGFQWQFSEDDGFSDPWSDIGGATSSSYEITDAPFTANGFYRLVADNGTTVTSDSAEVYLEYPEPAISSQPEGGAVEVGSNVSFTVAATGLGTLSYQWWSLDLGELADGGNISGTATATLSISNVQLADDDVYYCVITDSKATDDGLGEPDAEVDSADAVLEVFATPVEPLISFEPFISYPDATLLVGENPSVAGYTGAWISEAFGAAGPATSTGSLSFGGVGYEPGIGGKAGTPADAAGIAEGNSGRATRLLASELKAGGLSDRTLYLSWLFQTGNENGAADPAVYQTLALWNGDSGNDALRAFEAGLADDFGTGNFSFRVNNTTVIDLGAAPDAGVHLFVAKIELGQAAGSDAVTVWLDPAVGAGDPVGGAGLTGLDLEFDRLALSDYASNSATWDEIRWGTSFDAVTTTAPSVPLVPQITLQPGGYLGSVGDTVTLTAFAEGDPAPTYQWEFDADDGGGFSALPGATSATLVLDPAAYADIGYYRVVASNLNGSATSEEAYVELSYPDPVITQQPASVTAEEGSSVQLSVTATGLGPITYQWWKVDAGGDIQLSDGGALSGATTDTLQITGVVAADDGEYYVVVTDSAGAADTGATTETSGIATVASFEAWSGLVSEEPFDTAAGYVVGALDPQSPAVDGYTGEWTPANFGDARPAVASGSLSYGDAQYLGSSGDKVSVPTNTDGGEITGANSGRVYRQLGTQLVVDDSTTGARYLSFLFQSGQETGATSYQKLHLNQGGDGEVGRAFDIGLTDNGGFSGSEYNFAVNGSYSGTGLTSDTGVHLLVVKFDLSDTASGDAVTVWIDPSLGSGDPAGGVTVSGVDLAWNTLMFSDYDGNSAAWDELRWGSSFDSVTLNPNPPANDYAAWIAGYPGVGAMTGFEEDPDGDGIDNGVENFLGTAPDVFDAGPVITGSTSNSVTITHSRTNDLASDVVGSYEWSSDLASWNGSGATDGNGVTATISPVVTDDQEAPLNDTVEVTATVTGGSAARLFVRVVASQPAP